MAEKTGGMGGTTYAVLAQASCLKQRCRSGVVRALSFSSHTDQGFLPMAVPWFVRV
jgi:hypothetical protein